MAALLGITAYQPLGPGVGSLDLDSPEVESMRRTYGGQLQQVPYGQTRWYQKDLELCEQSADHGWLAGAGQLMQSARKDGMLAGLLSTRTAGLVRLPKRFQGDRAIRDALEAGHGEVLDGEARSVFDEMFPQQELALLAGDGCLLGVGVGELVPVEGRDYPVFVRLNPQFLQYRQNENRWYFSSWFGLLPITPGDGRWILHTPGGRNAPWQNGLWKAVGQAYIRKQHAAQLKDNWESKLANPARVAVSPQGASEAQKQKWFQQVMAWGVNTVFGVPPGYDAKLLESNGRGWESFIKTIEAQNVEYQIAIAGQTVTTDGGTGFANADIHKSIRADLIKSTADELAHTINTQGIPWFVHSRFGEDAVAKSPIVEWDVTPPVDRMKEAQALTQAAQAGTALDALLRTFGKQLDIEEFCHRFSIPNRPLDAVHAKSTAPALSLVQGGKEAV